MFDLVAVYRLVHLEGPRDSQEAGQKVEELEKRVPRSLP